MPGLHTHIDVWCCNWKLARFGQPQHVTQKLLAHLDSFGTEGYTRPFRVPEPVLQPQENLTPVQTMIVRMQCVLMQGRQPSKCHFTGQVRACARADAAGSLFYSNFQRCGWSLQHACGIVQCRWVDRHDDYSCSAGRLSRPSFTCAIYWVPTSSQRGQWRDHGALSLQDHSKDLAGRRWNGSVQSGSRRESC